MQIISWNILNRNKDISTLYSFLNETDADVYVFQELAEHHIAAIETLPGYTLHKALDFIEGEETAYLGILTRLPSCNPKIIVHNPDLHISPSWIGRRNAWRECIESLSITVRDGDQSVRIINAHLVCAASPSVRIVQLEDISQHFEHNERILLCADFNTFARPWYNFILGWFFGFKVHDLRTNEIASLKTFSDKHAMHRAFVNVVTFPRFRLQLDNMLVRGLHVTMSRVGTYTYGSDHRPLIATFDS